jgi:urease accessory protein UreE
LDTSKVAISPGDVVETDDGLLVLVRRQKEKLVVFEMSDPTEAFSLGFQLGNLHARVMVRDNTVSTPAALGEDLYLEKFAKHRPKFRAGDFEPDI